MTRKALHTRTFPFACLVACSLLASPLGAQEPLPLRTGGAHTGRLGPDDRHAFALTLADSTFVFGHVNQISLDVVVTVLGPDGKEIAEFDDPSRGPEHFTFTSGSAGTYLVAVTPFEHQSGDYEIRLLRSEPVAKDRGDRIDQLMVPYAGDATPGAVVGVVDRGKVVFARAYGMADLSFGIRQTLDTPTNIGSVTKQFTGMSILLLENDGLLSLDDDVRRHIPELPDFGAKVTIRNLLNHASGYREIYNFLPMTGRDGEDMIAREEAIRIVQRQPELQAEPDSEYNYNNTGYILLSMIVERVSGKSFPEFARERIFEPLGMTHTRVKSSQGEIIPGASTPYVSAESGGWRSARDLAASAGAGGIYTTFADMTKWMRNYTEATVGGPGAIERLTTPNVLTNGDTVPYGLGIGVGTRRGQRRYSHTGGDTAHRTYFSYFPDLQAGIFLSSNNASFGSSYGTLVPALEEMFFGDRLDPVEDEEHPAFANMSAQRMAAIAGEWFIEGPQIPVTITVENGELIATPTGESRQVLVPTSDSTVAIAALDVAITFHFETDGSVDRATFTQGSSSPMRRHEPVAQASIDLAGLAGRYFSRELELWLDVELEGDSLVVHRLRGNPMPLTQRDGLAFAGAFPFAQVVFQRAANGTITGLVAGNGRTKGVLFEKR